MLSSTTGAVGPTVNTIDASALENLAANLTEVLPSERTTLLRGELALLQRRWAILSRTRRPVLGGRQRFAGCGWEPLRGQGLGGRLEAHYCRAEGHLKGQV